MRKQIMSIQITKADSKGDLNYVDRLFPKFFNKDRLPKVRKQAEQKSVDIYIAKKSGKRIGFVIYHEISKDWVYIDFIAATGFGRELIKKLHATWQSKGFKGVNLDTFIYDGEMPRLSSTRRINFFYDAGYDTDVIDFPTPGHVVFHMTHKFASNKSKHGGEEKSDETRRISNYYRPKNKPKTRTRK